MSRTRQRPDLVELQVELGHVDAGAHHVIEAQARSDGEPIAEVDFVFHPDPLRAAARAAGIGTDQCGLIGDAVEIAEDDAARFDLDEHVLAVGNLRAGREVVTDLSAEKYEFTFTLTSSRLGQNRWKRWVCRSARRCRCCVVRLGQVSEESNPLRRALRHTRSAR